MADYYNRLGIAPDAPPEAVRQAFRTRARAVHPDAHPHLPPAEREALQRQFILLAQAYETLSDPARRARYDRERAAADAARSRAHPHARTAGPRTGRRAGGSAGTAAGPPPREESLDDLLRDVERLLRPFGLSLRRPFEELLEALLDWARALFREVSEAWERGAEAAGTARSRSGGADASESADPREEGQDTARGRAQDAAAVQRELDALKRRVRRHGPTPRGRAPGVEEELRRLKQRLGREG